uniref:AHNAK nucleoprotein n=1 Tax=Apteryx owenii TaxID=8824 RepID=A0A8B9PFP8_APTOW
MPDMHIKTPQISMPDIDLNLKGPRLKGNVDVPCPKLETDLKAPEIDVKGPKIDIEGPEVDVHGPEGKLKIPKMKLPKFGMPGFKGEGPEVDMNLPKTEVDLSGPKVDISVPDVSVEGAEGKLKGPKLKMPEMHVTVPKISMPDIDLNLKGHKTKGGFDITSPKAEGNLKGPEVDIRVPEFGVKGPEANVKLPKLKKPKFGFGVKSPKAEIKVPDAEVDFPEAELNVDSPDVSISGKAGPDVTIKGDVSVKSPKGKKPMFGKISFPDVEFDLKSHRFRGDASVAVPKIEGELKVPDPEVSVSTVKGEVKGLSLNTDVEAPDMSLKKPKLKLPSGQVVVGDSKIEVDLKGPAIDTSVPSVPVPDLDLSVKGPKVKGEIGVPAVELEGPEGKLKLPKVSLPKVGKTGPKVPLPDFDVNLKRPKIKGDLDVSSSTEGPKVSLDAPDVDIGGCEGKLKMPKFKSPTVEGPDLSMRGGVGCSIPQMEVDIKAPGANVDLCIPSVDIKGPSADISVPDFDVNLKGPKLKGDLDVSAGIKSPKVSVDAPDVGFEGPGGTIKLPSLKIPQFGISSPCVEGSDRGISLEGPQTKGGLKGSGVDVGLGGPDVELKGPKFQMQSPGVSLHDVDLKLKGPNVQADIDVASEIKGPKIGMEVPGIDIKKSGGGVHLDAPVFDASVPKLSTSDCNVNLKGPKIKGSATLSGNMSAPTVNAGGGAFHVTGPKVGIGGPSIGASVSQGSLESSLGKVSFPKLRMPKFAFSDPEAKGREVGVDVEFPRADASLHAGAVELELEDPDIRLKKSKIKMPKFNFSKQKGKSGSATGSPEASGSISGSKGDLKSSKVSLGSAEGDLDGGEGPSAKGKFSLFKSRKTRHRLPSLDLCKLSGVKSGQETPNASGKVLCLVLMRSLWP